MYKALTRFADLQDAGRIYEAGEEYPRPDFVVTAERLAELAGSDNRAGRPLIVRADETCETCAAERAETPVEADDAMGIEIPAEEQKPAQKPHQRRQRTKKE